jgi:hypothetical protein
MNWVGAIHRERTTEALGALELDAAEILFKQVFLIARPLHRLV